MNNMYPKTGMMGSHPMMPMMNANRQHAFTQHQQIQAQQSPMGHMTDGHHQQTSPYAAVLNHMNQMQNNQMQHNQMQNMSIPGPPPLDENTPGAADGNDNQKKSHAMVNSQLVLNSEDLPESDKDDEEYDGLYDNPGAAGNDMYGKPKAGATMGGGKTAGKIPRPQAVPVASVSDGADLEYGDDNNGAAQGNYNGGDGVTPAGNDEDYEYYEEEYEEDADYNDYDEEPKYDQVEQKSPHSDGDDAQFYSYEDLKNGALKDKENKHQYLSDQEFEEVFSMTKEKFNSLKPWKQKSLLRAKGLF